MKSVRRITTIAALATAAAFVAAPVASADYPPPGDQGSVQKPSGVIRNLTVKKTGCGSALNVTCFTTIQAAVNKARQAVDTKDSSGNVISTKVTHTAEYVITVSPGTYEESVSIVGHAFDGLTLKGSTTNPRDVKLELKNLAIDKAQNGLIVNGASGVTIKNMSTFNYIANGFFFVNINAQFGGSSFLADNLVAAYSGNTNGYGLYEFNSIGGTFSNDEAYYNSDAGLYIGQTPVQTRPVRSLVTGFRSYLNELGYSGTNSKYVTITKGKWYNNGLGIVPNMLLSEQFWPPEQNIIIDNDVYGNNFNFYKSAPFPVAHGALGANADYPPGVGIMLLGSKDTTVQNNRVWGNHLVGIGGMDPKTLLSLKTTPQIAAAKFERNKIIGNTLGNGGANKNGWDIFLFGGGTDNGTCVGGTGANANIGVLSTAGQEGLSGKLGDVKVPWNTCPAASTAHNGFSPTAFVLAGNAVGDSTHQKYWKNTSGQGAVTGFKPLETCTITAGYTGCDGQIDGKP